MFSYLSLEHRVPPKHPLRAVRELVDVALRDMNVALAAMYSHTGRPLIPPERLIPALLQIFYSIGSEHESNLSGLFQHAAKAASGRRKGAGISFHRQRIPYD